jgi:hypothetical protein
MAIALRRTARARLPFPQCRRSTAAGHEQAAPHGRELMPLLPEAPAARRTTAPSTARLAKLSAGPAAPQPNYFFDATAPSSLHAFPPLLGCTGCHHRCSPFRIVTTIRMNHLALQSSRHNLVETK